MVGDPGLILSVFAGLVFATRPEFTNAFFHLAVKRPTPRFGLGRCPEVLFEEMV